MQNNNNVDLLKFFKSNRVFSIAEIIENSNSHVSNSNSSHMKNNEILNIKKSHNFSQYEHINESGNKAFLYVVENDNSFNTIFKTTTNKDVETTTSYHLIKGVIPNIEKLSAKEISHEFKQRVCEELVLRNMPSQGQERIVVRNKSGISNFYEGDLAKALDNNGLTPETINVNNHKKRKLI